MVHYLPLGANRMPYVELGSEILRYIIENKVQPGERLPTINELGEELGVSVSKVREELAVARALGHVQIKPRLGMLVQPFDFAPATALSVLYALGLDRTRFQDFSELRKSVELSFWHEAVALLTPDDIALLRDLVRQARTKLTQVPIEVPFQAHRQLHLMFFKHLQNPFVQGILEAYWTAYKAFGLALYADLSYHREVWDYHERMVECVARGDFDAAHRALHEHMQLLRYLPEHHNTDGRASKSSERSSSIRSFFE
ncbi:MAG: FCD domain-containing protein [Anaerolineae bacterium]|nr:FCD domain-containing protein [Anaerolineae bacterium]